MVHEEKIANLTMMLNECLETQNQEGSFTVISLEDDKFLVEFTVLEDDNGDIMFNGY